MIAVFLSVLKEKEPKNFKGVRECCKEAAVHYLGGAAFLEKEDNSAQMTSKLLVGYLENVM